ncbi:MAG: UvrD-helicase domain-containing protein [Burkholderiales bacterium]|nr:UvrD-helicase domain-containing protein [Burkholderiales bacterium]
MFPEVADASPLLHNLNPEQRAAVTLPNEHALILAGAGSGKTRVLTTRIAWLLSTGQVGPGGVMAVTFTNKAAKEMMTRLQAMLPVNVRGMWIGTFHGLCNRFLRAHWKLAALPSTFQILDTQDQLSAIKRVMKAHNVDEERFPAREMQWYISGNKEEGLRPNMVETRTEDDRRKVEIYQLYEDQCNREGVVDFGELMLRSYEVLRDNDPLREHYRRRFRHILIDEFQDTNRLQYQWIKMFAGEANSVFAVGDDDQSIYAFRGARVGNMKDFVGEFEVRHQIKLEQNYRSFSNILDSANELISHNKQRLGKNLRTDQGAGEPVRVYEAPTDMSEAQWTVEEIRNLVREDIERNEIAVLYRSNAQSRVLETALFNASVPYRVYGGLRFFERAEIKHALAYLRLLENGSDDTSFLRVVNFPPRGIGARTIEQLQDAARARQSSLHDAVAFTTGKGGNNLAAFVAMIDSMRSQTEGLTLREIIDVVLRDSGLIDHYRSERDGADRIENLEELVNAAESFVTQEGFGRDAVALPIDELGGTVLRQSPASQGLDPSQPDINEPAPDYIPPDSETGETLSPLAAFLTHAALESGDNQAQAGQDAVQLMTVHAAKGLEFDCVFVTGLEEGLFPSERSMADRDGLEEERRLMYVAITRARKRLYLTHSQTRLLHGQTRYNVRSRFFDELPEHALKWLTPKNQAFGKSAFGFGMGYPTSRPRETYASPPVPAQKAGPAHGLRPGMQVFHNKFGEGTVLTLEGSGEDARAQINFPRHGHKWLALSVAKLTPVP